MPILASSHPLWGFALVTALAAQSSVTIRVTREPLVPGEIRREQCGQFVEYLCDLVPGMWAEKLSDGSFEGLTPYRFEYLRATDDKEHPWLPSGATNRVELERDTAQKIQGEASLRLSTNGTTPCTVGIEQGGIAVEKGEACTFSCWMRAENISGSVRVRLVHAGSTIATAEFAPEREWKPFRARLIPGAGSDAAKLVLEFRGPAKVWIDAASLMPEKSVGGWRPDVVEALRALHCGVIRFGGSALDDPNLGDFEWRDTVGSLEHRRPFRAWGGLQPVGAGLAEFVDLCRAVDAEPLLCLRVRERTPKDAADEVQYFNGAVDTPMGRLRAEHGHPEPYRVRYFQVGNEQGGPEYERRLPEFCKAIRAADPDARILSSYPSPGVLDGAAEYLDFVSPHHYGCADLDAMQRDLDSIRALIATHARGRPIHVAVTEWNTTAGDAGPHRAMLWTLANALACSRYQNLLHRNADLVEIANRSNLTNSFCSGILQTDNHRLYETPTYFAQQMYATLALPRPVRIESSLPRGKPVDLSATASADGANLALFAVNDGTEACSASIDVSAFATDDEPVRTVVLADRDAAGEPDAVNGFDRPDRVAPVIGKLRARGGRIEFVFPPLSLSVLSLVRGP
jgi:alpha-L-arabinofuranosidase